MKNKIESNIIKYHAYNFFNLLSFWLPIFILYYLSKGLNYTQVMWLAVIAAVFHLAFEVPSGIFADFFGRKKTLIIASLFRLLSIVLIFFANDFKLFAISNAVFGIGMAFSSGTNSAFLYDTLKDLKREKEYKKIEGKAFSYQMWGMALGSLIGGFFLVKSFELAVFMTIIAFGIASLVTFTFIEPKHHKKSEERDYFKHLKDAAFFSINHPKVRFTILFSTTMFALMLTSHKLIQPYIQMANVDLKYFGIIYFVFIGVAALAARFAHIIEEFFGEFWSLFIIPIVLGIQFFLMGSFISVYILIPILLGELAFGFLGPVIKDYVNRYVESYHRATVLSLDGFLQNFIIIIISPFFGYIVDAYALTTALLIEGVIVLVLGIPLVLLIIDSNKQI